MIGIPGDVLDLALDGPAFEIGEVHAIGSDDGQVAIGKKENVARVIENRGHVGRHEVFVVAQADDRRRAVARGHDFVGIVGGDHGERENAAELLHGLRTASSRDGCWPLPGS